MSTQCVITFDNPNGVYESGTFLRGNVVLTTLRTKSIRGIQIVITGYAETRWKENEQYYQNNRNQQTNISYHGREEYLNSSTYVIGSADHNSFNLTAGEHNYLFSCNLPEDLPTSIWESYGHVRYEIILIIDRPGSFNNIFKQAFTVIRTLNLNDDPNYRLSKSGTDTTYHWCWCCACCQGGSGEIFTECKIPLSGYVPGQNINFTLCVFNESKSDYEHGIADLIKEITFASQTPERKLKIIKSTIISKPLSVNATRFSRKEYYGTIQVPSTQSTSYSRNLIRISYYFIVKLKGLVCDNDMEIKLPITIGTIPIQLSHMPQRTLTRNNVITRQPNASAPPTVPLLENVSNETDVPPSYSEFVPPSYEEAVKPKGMRRIPTAEGDIPHVEGPYEPKYPFYGNTAAPGAPYRFVDDARITRWRLARNYERSLSEEAPIEHKWLQTNVRQVKISLPPGAFLAGHFHGEEMYIGRAYYKGDLLPAKVLPRRGAAYISWDGYEIHVYNFEILLGNQFDWIPSHGGNIPSTAMSSGSTVEGEKLYVGRGVYDGTQCVGKIIPSHSCLYLPYNGLEKYVRNYEVLILMI